MNWRVVFHPLVLKQDLPALDHSLRREVIKAVRKKLMVEPEIYGEPLRRGLFGYWKLRVGSCRVVYRVEKEIITVLVLKIGLRKDEQVYRGMMARFKVRG